VLSIANAQFTKIGGGITGSTGIAWNNETDTKSHRTNNPAITLKGIYEISVPLHIEPSFTYLMPRVTKTTFGAQTTKQIVSAMMVDVNGHYVFNSLDRFEFYGLAGLNVTLIGMKWVSEIDGNESKSKESDNAFGLNLGAGAYMKLTEQFDLFGEAKYILGKYDQFVFTVGVLINIDWLKKHENTDM
jgi:opacity protein-like surface antigen